jgi:hypothetical protein
MRVYADEPLRSIAMRWRLAIECWVEKEYRPEVLVTITRFRFVVSEYTLDPRTVRGEYQVTTCCEPTEWTDMREKDAAVTSGH